MERDPSTIFFSYPQNDSHSVGIHQQSSNKSNRAREFLVLAMDGNSISFTQFRAFASGRAIDDSTGVPIISRRFQRFLGGVQITARANRNSFTTYERSAERFLSPNRPPCGDRNLPRDSHGPVATCCACKVIAVIHTMTESDLLVKYAAPEKDSARKVKRETARLRSRK